MKFVVIMDHCYYVQLPISKLKNVYNWMGVDTVI